MTDDRPKPKNSDMRNLLLGTAGSLIAAAAWAIGAAFVPKVFATAVTLPLWGYLTLLTVFALGFAWTVVFFRRQLRREIDDYEESLSEWKAAGEKWERALAETNEEHTEAVQEWSDSVDALTAELADEREFVFDGGLYYRATDTDRKQPFCRVCWEADERLTTVVDYYETNDGDRYYECTACQRGHKLMSPAPRPAAEPELDGEDIPF